MQDTNPDTQEVSVKSKRKFKIKGPAFGTSGFLMPLLFSIQAGGVMTLIGQIEHPTVETKIAVVATLVMTIFMTSGEDVERFIRRRLRRKAAKGAEAPKAA